ncbi:hypothetical protein DXP84_05575 [Listeria monocytogenes serotype 4a]|nr:hypothetical protein [Listeria monocytogenes]MDA19393.1 hypothetical protein [Listeria monocytogenes serotype 4a]EAC3450864.1 hypothetical protein [Listeria monocytogenes]EAC3747864.1 hypothetical protein [Listeria monocytogenes]EAC4592478.1 hypothetical protein [Listeria monocytogenes]
MEKLVDRSCVISQKRPKPLSFAQIKKLLPLLVKEFDTIIRKFRDRKFFSQEKERKKQPDSLIVSCILI